MIARGSHSKQLTAITRGNFISSSVLNPSSNLMEEEVDLDALPETIIPEELRPKKRRNQRNKKDIMIRPDMTWNVDSSDEGEENMKAFSDEPVIRPFNRATLMSGEGEEEIDLESLPPSQSVGLTHHKTRLTILSDDSEEESDIQEEASSEAKILQSTKTPPLPPGPWTEEENSTLYRLLEENRDMIDPWGMVMYDSYFMERGRSSRDIIQHGIDLGLLPPSTPLPEETEVKSVMEESSDEEVVSLSREIYTS